MYATHVTNADLVFADLGEAKLECVFTLKQNQIYLSCMNRGVALLRKLYITESSEVVCNFLDTEFIDERLEVVIDFKIRHYPE